MSFNTQCNIYMSFKMINTYICHLIQIMNNASLDRLDQRDTTRGGKSLAPHAKSPMGGAGLRNTKAERCAQARHGALRQFLEPCPSRSWRRTKQVQPLQWEHGVWPCAAAAADSKWREVLEQVGREAHKRAVLAPVVVSAMFKTRLLGAANMEQVN